jgi:uncharacterized Ntn-hydrolase superfamily protein
VTYSIVARDPDTGDFGVAVQSHYLSVGGVCPWARAGVGAVATQSLVEPSYGPLGLDLMAAGKSAADALAALLAVDQGAQVRQVAMVDAAGAVSTHTGSSCIAEAGHVVGDGFSVQANMMRRATVWDAMASAYSSSTAPPGGFVGRLLAALDAAEAEGGDIRGRQSAALLVVRAEGTGRPWHDTLFDLRVEDHAEPLAELRRLVDLRRAYTGTDDGDEAMARGDTDAARAHYQRAIELAPGNPELAFWFGVSLGAAGRVDEARPVLALAFGVHDGWAELLRRLPAAGLFPDDPALLDALLAPDS